jgi:predicted RNase H-like HicB family nuclease
MGKLIEETNKKHSYRVFWSEEDGEYVGLCSEFPGISHLDETQEKALKGIQELVEFAIQVREVDYKLEKA